MLQVKKKKPAVRSQTRWLDYIKDLDWNHLGLRLNEMCSVLVDREVWRLNLNCRPAILKEKRMKRKENFVYKLALCVLKFLTNNGWYRMERAKTFFNGYLKCKYFWKRRSKKSRKFYDVTSFMDHFQAHLVKRSDQLLNSFFESFGLRFQLASIEAGLFVY